MNNYENYKVSLITACYNIEEKRDISFEEYLESIRNQTIGYENIEHILVNDGSTDNTKEILNMLSKNYSNVYVYHLEKNNGSPGIPRNFGIQKATSKYIMFLDRDDSYLENSIKILYNKIIEYDVDIVTSNYCIYDGKNIIKHKIKKEEEYSVNKNNSNFYDAKISDQSTIFDRRFLLSNNIKYGTTSAAEDYFFHINALINTNKEIIVLNNVYSRIFSSENDNSLSHKFDKKQLNGCIDTFKILMNNIMKKNIHKQFLKDFFKESILVSMGTFLRSNETIENKKNMFNKIREYIIEFREVDLETTLYWKIVYYLFLSKCFYLLEFSSFVIKLFFNNKIFKKIFRNK